jgi:hypothetical protein
MICPECAESSEANARGCRACSYEFAFHPEADGTTDAEWLELVARASAEGNHCFSENQLYCQYARGRVQTTRYISRRGGIGLAMVALGLSIWIYGLKVDWGISLVLGIAITLTGVAQVGTGVVTRRDPADRAAFTRLLEKWLASKKLAQLVRSGELANAGLEFTPPKVDYLLILERDALVDLFLKNDAHQHLSALILSENGYPSRLVPEARRLLDERSDLKVVALHDATQAGVGMTSRLAASSLLPLRERALLDAGLFAAEVGQIEQLNSAFPASHVTRVPLDALSYVALLAGLRGVARGALSISAGIFEAADAIPRAPSSERAA